MKRRFPPLATCLGLGLLSSCSEEKIRTYRVAREAAPEAAEAVARPAASRVTWTAPDTWRSEPTGQFQTAAYALDGACRLTISMLPGDGGGIPANVNRWRGQIGLAALPEDQVGGQPLKLPDGKSEMLLLNLSPSDPAPDARGILAAILPLDSETWYFKLSGPAAELKKHGPVYMTFLRGVRVAGSSEAAAPAVPRIHCDTPDGWLPSEGSAMRAASFTATGSAGGQADVSVVPLPGDSGTDLDNVNRWRAQLQLAPLESADDPALGTTLGGAAGPFLLSAMTSTGPLLDGDKRASIIAAILRKPGMTWFFKISGDATTVEENRGKFEAFVRSATFP